MPQSKDLLQPLALPRPPTLRHILPNIPILVVKFPKLLASNRVLGLVEPLRLELDAVGLPLLAPGALGLFDAVLLFRSEIVLALFHGALIRTQAGVGRGDDWAETVREIVEGDDEGRDVEGDAGGARVSFPDESGLVTAAACACAAGDVGFVAGSVASVELVVPAAANGPRGVTVFADDFAADLMGGGSFPALGFEVKDAGLAGCPVLDFHGAVVVDSWVTGDDANDGGCDLLPGIELFTTTSGAEAKEPGTKWVEFKGLAIELGLDGRLAIVIPILAFGVGSTDGRVVADLLDEEAVTKIRTHVFVSLSQKRVERFGNAANSRSVL